MVVVTIAAIYICIGKRRQRREAAAQVSHHEVTLTTHMHPFVVHCCLLWTNKTSAASSHWLASRSAFTKLRIR